MVKTLFYIQVLPKEKIAWSIPLLEWAKKNRDTVTTFDFDNFSDAFIVDKAMELAVQAEKLAVVIRSAASISPGLVTRFLNRLSRLNNKEMLVLNLGDNELIEKMTRMFGNYQIKSEIDMEEQKKILLGFL